MSVTEAKMVTARHTASQLRISIGAFKRRARDAIVEGELSKSQLRVLARLERHGTATTAELARAEQMTPQATGAIVGILERLGLVIRTADGADRRRVILTIADAGRLSVHSGRSALVDKMTSALIESFTPEELAALDRAAPLIQRLSDLL